MCGRCINQMKTSGIYRYYSHINTLLTLVNILKAILQYFVPFVSLSTVCWPPCLNKSKTNVKNYCFLCTLYSQQSSWFRLWEQYGGATWCPRSCTISHPVCNSSLMPCAILHLNCWSFNLSYSLCWVMLHILSIFIFNHSYSFRRLGEISGMRVSEGRLELINEVVENEMRRRRKKKKLFSSWLVAGERRNKTDKAQREVRM